VTNTTPGSLPSFNQIAPTEGIVNPVDPGSSTLFMRNLQFVEPTCNGITSSGTVPGPIAEIKTVENKNIYNNSVFPFSNYFWDSQMVDRVEDIGVCGDARFRTLTNDAVQILFKDTSYNSNGTWLNSDGTLGQDIQQWTNWNSKPGSSNAPRTVIDGFTPSTKVPTTRVYPAPSVKYTNAMSDTADSIQSTMYNGQQYSKLMKQVNKNYQELSNEIPEYIATRNRLHDNVNADYNGNTLLYLRTTPVPNAQQKNIMDVSEQGTMQNMVYVLGTITAATLLVFAMILARD